jgi:hypothetical protein
MKKLNQLLFIVALFFATSIYAQSSPKVYAVVSKASWCPTCVKNEARVGSEVLTKIDQANFQIVVNDLSDKNTKSVSAKSLKEIGLENINLKSTGIITFIDADSKKVLSSISVDKSSEELTAAFQKIAAK